MYKVIFMDIDGTIKNHDTVVSQRIIDGIKNICSLGIYVILCTGRPRAYTEKMSKECGASKYIITSGGAEVYDYEEKRVIYNNGMDANACEKLYDIAEEYNARFIMNVDNVRVVNKLKHMDGSEVLLKENIKDFLSNNTVLQCIITDSDLNKIKEMREYIEEIDGTKITNKSKCLVDSSIKPMGSIYYDVAKSDTSKGEAIKIICKYLNIPLNDTIGIGDDHNDIPMFEVVGHSVTMEDSHDNVKYIAKEVIKSNNDNGLAEYLENLYRRYITILE